MNEQLLLVEDDEAIAALMRQLGLQAPQELEFS